MDKEKEVQISEIDLKIKELIAERKKIGNPEIQDDPVGYEQYALLITKERELQQERKRLENLK